MPLIKGSSREAVSANIKAEKNAGAKQDQAVAIALDTARRYAKAAGGPVQGYGPGGWVGETYDPADLTREILPPERPRNPEPATTGFAGFLNRIAPHGPSRQERAMTEAQRVMDQPAGEFLTEAGVGAAAPYVLGPLVSRIPKRLVAAGAAGLAGSLLGGDTGTAEGTPVDARNAEIAKLQEQISGLQSKVVGAQKDIGASKFRGVGEEAGLARQKALEQAAKPFNDAIAAAQDRIRELRGANDEEQNALVRGERMADRARREELGRGKPFNQTAVGEQWEKLGPLAPAIAGGLTAAAARVGHGPKVGWKLPIAEGTGAGAAASNVPIGWDAFFSPVANPERKAYQTYGQELKVVQHPRAQEFLDYANTLPQYNPVRGDAQKEFFDPWKAGERIAFGAGEGLLGAGTGLASAVGLERLGAGVKSLFGSRSASPTGSLTPNPSTAAPELPGLTGRAAEAPLPLTAMPESRMLPSASPTRGLADLPQSVADKALALTKRPVPSAEAGSSLPASKSASSASSRPEWAGDAPEHVLMPKGKGWHWDAKMGQPRNETGEYGTIKYKSSRPPKDSGKLLTTGKGNGSGTDDGHKSGGVVARALEIARSYARGGKVTVGAVVGNTGGRADKLPVDVPSGSFVIPADCVSGMPDAGGNTEAGYKALERMFGKPQAGKSASGAVPIQISHGEFVLDPFQVAKVGGGDVDKGHAILEAFVKQVRAQNLKTIASLPGPHR